MRNNFAKKLGMSLAAFGLVATSMFTVQDAEAVPAFARQTGMPCNACHFQQFPTLNAMGRSFMAGGFTMEGTQGSIEGENAMKLPENMNISAIAKIRHVATNAAGDEVGDIQWPDEAAFLMGGRASANMGFLYEIGMAGQEVEAHLVDKNGDAVGNNSTDYDHVAGETSGAYLSTKFHFLAAKSGDIQFSVIPYATDGLGAMYGYDPFNTAAKRSQRGLENRKALSAYQATGIGSGAATGIALVAATPSWFVNYSAWGPVWGGGQADPAGLAALIRAGYFMNAAGFEIGLGVTSMSGAVKTESSDAVEGDTADVNVAGTGIDIQLQGDVAGMPLGVWITNATAPAGSADAKETYNSSTTDDATSTAIAAKLMVTPDLGVAVANSSYARGTDEGKARTSAELSYSIAQNIRFEYIMNTETPDVGDSVSETMMQLFMGF